MSRAIILAAGRGSRMGAETDNKPKCLTVLKGKCLLDWQIESLTKASIQDISIVGGYKNEMLKDRGLKVTVNERWSETNMVASLMCSEASDAETIISYSDIVYSYDHVKRLKESKHDITITADKDWFDLWSLRFENPLEDAETFTSNDSELTSIGKKTDNLKDIEAQYMGLIKLTKKGWDTIEQVYNGFTQAQKDKLDMTTLLNTLLENKISVNVVFVDGKWCEVDNYSDALAYEKALETKNNWSHDWRN